MDKKRLGGGRGGERERGGRGPPYTLLTTRNISTKYPI